MLAVFNGAHNSAWKDDLTGTMATLTVSGTVKERQDMSAIHRRVTAEPHRGED